MDARVGSGANDTAAENTVFPAEYSVTLRLTVEDATALWSAAADRCADQWKLNADEAEELIGPREDPSIEDCLMMMALPATVTGCELTDVAIRRVPRPDCEKRAASGQAAADAPIGLGAQFRSVFSRLSEDKPSGLIWRS